MIALWFTANKTSREPPIRFQLNSTKFKWNFKWIHTPDQLKKFTSVFFLLKCKKNENSYDQSRRLNNALNHKKEIS